MMWSLHEFEFMTFKGALRKKKIGRPKLMLKRTFLGEGEVIISKQQTSWLLSLRTEEGIVRLFLRSVMSLHKRIEEDKRKVEYHCLVSQEDRRR